MITEFNLKMYDLVINCRHIDQVTIQWIEEMPQARILAISARWLHSKDFLTRRMDGLEKVGESSLTLIPIDYEINEK